MGTRRARSTARRSSPGPPGDAYRRPMSESNESDDWIAGSEMTADASNLTYFGGMSIPIDTSGLPDPPADESEVS
jgi:hypothetical protein